MRKTKEQNSKHQIPNTNKGITLIALVITIIVMLILVAVTISMAVNGGLFDFAGRATTETQNAIDREQLLAEGKIEIDGTWYNSLDEYVNATPEIHNWTRSGDTFTCAHCNTTYTMGDVVNYEPTGKTSTTITAQMSGLDKYYTKNSSYPTYINVDENGNQTIEAQDATWVVLGMEDTNGNGTYETLLITTQSPVTVNSSSQKLYFYGAAAYNNGPEEIDRICEELYSNSEYGTARGMTMEDVNNTLEYIPNGAYYYNGSNWVTTGNLTTKLKDLEIFEDMVASGTLTPDGTNTQAVLGEYELTSYGYKIGGTDNLTVQNYNDNTISSTITEVERNTIFGASIDYYYWLATKGVYAEEYGSTFACFILNQVSGDSAGSYHHFFFVSDGSNFGTRNSCAFRPVVSLTSNLPTSAS